MRLEVVVLVFALENSNPSVFGRCSEIKMNHLDAGKSDTAGVSGRMETRGTRRGALTASAPSRKASFRLVHAKSNARPYCATLNFHHFGSFAAFLAREISSVSAFARERARKALFTKRRLSVVRPRWSTGNGAESSESPMRRSICMQISGFHGSANANSRCSGARGPCQASSRNASLRLRMKERRKNQLGGAFFW